jgi:DNA-binding PadR family transcriptional regulator
MTDGEVTISPGTMYGTLSKMEKDGLITFLREEDKRKLYQISPLGREILDIEIRRIERLYKNSQEDLYNE